MGEMGETGDSNGVGFVRAAIPKADDAFVAGLGETGMPWETPALALRAAAASMMRRAAARFRASGVASTFFLVVWNAEPDGEASVKPPSAGLRVPASGDICREGLGVEVADADREGLGGGENTKFVTGSLAALGERRRAGLAAAMMRRAAATLSIAGEARRPSAPPSGFDGNGEGGGFRGVNGRDPPPDALASAERTVSSSAKRGGYVEALSTRGGDAGERLAAPPESGLPVAAARLFVESSPSPNANVEPEVSRDATGDVASVSARAGSGACSGAGSGVGSNARHSALEGVFVLGGLACV